MILDSGASTTSLRKDLFPLFGVASWDAGQPRTIGTASEQNVVVYRYLIKVEVLGKQFDCPIDLITLPPNPMFSGLFGREDAFREFGFGFWESSHEILVTTNP